MISSVQVQPHQKTLGEVAANGDGGTFFPYGAAVKFPCDEHRREYSDADAREVADMVNGSSWLQRAGR